MLWLLISFLFQHHWAAKHIIDGINLDYSIVLMRIEEFEWLLLGFLEDVKKKLVYLPPVLVRIFFLLRFSLSRHRIHFLGLYPTVPVSAEVAVWILRPHVDSWWQNKFHSFAQWWETMGDRGSAAVDCRAWRCCSKSFEKDKATRKPEALHRSAVCIFPTKKYLLTGSLQLKEKLPMLKVRRLQLLNPINAQQAPENCTDEQNAAPSKPEVLQCKCFFNNSKCSELVYGKHTTMWCFTRGCLEVGSHPMRLLLPAYSFPLIVASLHLTAFTFPFFFLRFSLIVTLNYAPPPFFFAFVSAQSRCF